MRPQLRALVPLACTALAVACGGDGGVSVPDQGRMKLAVTDAPVDGAQKVVVEFTGVELIREGGDPLQIDFASPRTIDLLNDSGTASAVLFDQPLPAGDYEQVRLKVTADGDPGDSFIQLSDGTVHGLRIPSGAQSGLKLVSGFSVPAGGVANYTIDFDLRKAITCPPGQAPACLLKPALRLVNDASVGAIAGEIDPALLAPADCTPAVYLFAGGASTPDDYGGATEPVASKVPVQTATALSYQFGFLQPGSYTVAYTCDGALDDPEADDSLVFSATRTAVAVTAGATTTADLP